MKRMTGGTLGAFILSTYIAPLLVTVINYVIIIIITVCDIFVDIKLRFVHSNWSTLISDFSCKLHLPN